jgi:antitoxin component YwqK of YwqJK toxin-antitoxin module
VKPFTKKEYYLTGQIERITHFNNPECQSGDRPADIWYHLEGYVIKHTYMLHSVVHRNNKPAVITYYPDGSVAELQYMHRDFGTHREDGPAIETFSRSGEMTSQSFYLRNRLHNENGPAYIRDSYVTRSGSYWLEDMIYTVEEFRLRCLIVNNQAGLASTFEDSGVA